MSRRWIASFGVLVFVAVLSVPASGQQAQSGTKLLSPDADYYSEQGRSVGIAADGQTAVVGGRPPYIWARRDGVWRQFDKLVGSGAVGGADQGWAVAISADGNTAIVGGDNDDGSGPEGYHYGSASGAAWVWTKSDGGWSQQGPKLVGGGAIGKAKQGTSVALSADGNTAIIGGPNDNGAVGAAWVWIRIGGVWTQQAKLVGSGGSGINGSSQGRSVALSADGNTAIIGGDSDNNLVGAAWVWTRSGGVWTQQGAKLVGSSSREFSNVPGGTYQGTSVALSADGNTALIGGPGNGLNGAAWVWRRSGEIWSQQSKLDVWSNPAVSTTSILGDSVSLSADGNTALVGASGSYISYVITPGQPFAGATWLWTYTSGKWSVRSTPLIGSDGGGAQQGCSVALTGDGRTAIVGSAWGRAAWVLSTDDTAGPRRRVVRH